MNYDRYNIDGLAPSTGVFKPDDVPHLQAFMSDRNLADEAVSVVGGGTRLQFGNKLQAYDYAVDMASIDEVLSHNEADLTCRVQAGLKMKTLQDLLNSHGQFLAIDCPFPEKATVGGTLASNAPGFLRWQLAHMRDMVIGMQVVFATGTLTKSGGQVVKNVSGYDMARLHVGGLGTLGIITEVCFKLTPMPTKQGSLLISFASRVEAYEFSKNIFNSYAMPLALAVVDSRLVEMTEGRDLLGSTAVIVRLGGREKAFERQIKIVSDISKTACVSGLELLDDHESSTRWNEIRDYGWLDPKIQTILSVSTSPVGTKVAEEVVRKVLDGSAANYNVISQPGFGLLYVYLSGIPSGSEEYGKVISELRHEGNEIGVTVGFEKMPESEKVDIDVWPPVEPRVFELMQRLKNTYDPGGILNKGRFIGRI